MKLEDQVVSLELSKRLKELGVKQESHFYWVENFDDIKGWRIVGLNEICGGLDDHFAFRPDDIFYEQCISAFTVVELGHLLDKATGENLIKAYGYIFNVFDTKVITATGLKELLKHPNLSAKMLIYLLENKLI